MNSCALIISTCRHTLASGRRCRQPAVRGRTCCRHHLDSQTRLHSMARARRRSVIVRFRAATTLRDLVWNESEVNRVLATERLDPDAARMMLWAMDLSASALHAEEALRLKRVQNVAANFNEIYEVPISPLVARTLTENLSQLIESTRHTSRGSSEQRMRRARAKS